MANFEIWIADDEPGIDQVKRWLEDFLHHECEMTDFWVTRSESRG